MIWTIIQVSLRRLLHNRIELLLTFVVPIAFFSVFALIFGRGIGSGTTPRVKVVMVDQADSEQSHTVIESLRSSAGLRCMDQQPDREALSIDQASDLVRRGSVTIGIVLKPTGQDSGGGLSADLLADASDQVAGQVVSALVSRELAMSNARRSARALTTSGPEMSLADRTQPAASRADRSLDDRPPGNRPSANGQPPGNRPPPAHDRPPSMEAGAAAGPEVIQAQATVEAEPQARTPTAEPAPAAEPPPAAEPGAAAEDAVKIVDVMGQGKANPVVSMYAAGIAVMFLLFGATGGGGVLLEERENTTLDRLLSTRVTMDQLLLGKWFYLSALGVVQVAVMFVWGQLVFGVDLVGHLDGFVMMTVVTSAAAAAFGLFLATLCKTRGQLNGLSVILILTMSALGGSMVPRYVMSERMRELGLWTFNAWALDGYNKVFWRDLPVESLWPQLAVLMGAGIGFLLVARALATRWEFD